MKLGLSLGGGGVKGAAHIGVIKALEENGIKIDYIGGTSIGSIVSSMYAMGYTTDEMLKLFKYFSKDMLKIDPKYFWNNVKNKQHVMGYGLISGENIENVINECAKLKKVSKVTDLQMPVVFPTVDIKESKKYLFTNHEFDDYFTEDYCIRNVNIGKAVRSSASYPGVFAPTIVSGHKFVDGGIMDNLPSTSVRKLGADKVLAIRFSSDNKTDPKSMLEVITKSVDLLFAQRTATEVENSDFAITLDLPEASVFNIKKIDYCYNQGYINTIANMDKIKKMLKE